MNFFRRSEGLLWRMPLAQLYELYRLNSIIFLIFLFVSACKPENKWDCLKGTGKPMTKEVYLTTYDSLYIEGEMTINLIQDTINFVTLSGGRNLLAKIEATVESNSLTIKDKNDCKWTRSYKKSKIQADIHFTRLQKIIFRDGADLFTPDTLHLDTLIIDVWSKIGTTDINIDANYIALKLNAATGLYKFSGKTDYCILYSVGNGYIYTDNLKTSDGWIYSNTTGKTTFWISNTLDLKILNSGNIYYRGSKPTVTLDKKPYATGQLLPLEN